MTDEMIIRSDFLQGIIKRLIKKALSKKLGIDASIIFNAPIEFKNTDDGAKIHVDLTASLKKEDLKNLVDLFI